MKKVILKATNLHKSFDQFGKVEILKNINLELQEGQSIAIMGASGEGKTTLLHLLGGLENPTLGQIYIDDLKLEAKNCAKIRNSSIGFVFQTYNLLEDLTVFTNIIMPAKIARKDNKKTQKRVLDLLKEVNLENRKHYLTKYLSGGEKQRAAIARCFCNDPKIILADEPSGNLDHLNSQNIHQLLLSSVKKKNKSLIIATHDEALANLCDEKFLLKEGLLHKIS